MRQIQYQLTLPPRLVGELLHRREEILEHAAGTEVKLGVNEHAGDEAQMPTLALEVAAGKADQRAVGCFPDGIDGRIAAPRSYLRIAAHRNPAVTRAKLELQKIEPGPFNHWQGQPLNSRDKSLQQSDVWIRRSGESGVGPSAESFNSI